MAGRTSLLCIRIEAVSYKRHFVLIFCQIIFIMILMVARAILIKTNFFHIY